MIDKPTFIHNLTLISLEKNLCKHGIGIYLLFYKTKPKFDNVIKYWKE